MYRNIFIGGTFIYLVVIIVAGLLAFQSRSKQPAGFDKLWIYFGILVLVEIIVDLSKWVFKVDMTYFLALYNIFGIIEFWFIKEIYKQHYQNINAKKWLNAGVYLYAIFVILNLWLWPDDLTYNYTYIVRCIFFIFLTIQYFIKFTQIEDIQAKGNPTFMLSVGLFVFSMSIVFVQALGSDIPDPELGFAVFLISILLNIYLYIMFIVSLLCYRRKPESS